MCACGADLDFGMTEILDRQHGDILTQTWLQFLNAERRLSQPRACWRATTCNSSYEAADCHRDSLPSRGTIWTLVQVCCSRHTAVWDPEELPGVLPVNEPRLIKTPLWGAACPSKHWERDGEPCSRLRGQDLWRLCLGSANAAPWQPTRALERADDGGLQRPWRKKRKPRHHLTDLSAWGNSGNWKWLFSLTGLC